MNGTKAFVLLALAAMLLVSLPVSAQVPTGTVTGKVADASGDALPGVLITAESDALQGTRTATSDVNGNYKLGFLPAGLYELTYGLDGFGTATKTVRVSAAQAPRVDTVVLQLADVTEEILVTSSLDTVSDRGAVATTVGQDELEKLPVARNITQAVDLVPGVHRSGPTRSGSREGNVSISGAMSFENLWTVNGVVVNENLRGQPLDLFIEDAIQETTTQTGGISAEFGRFTGGVVNVLTKSGSNEFHGGLRVNLANQDWEEPTELTASQEDQVNDTYEATLGGKLMTDKLWFFLAGRDFDRATQATTARTLIPFDETRAQTRIEGKLTANITESHNFVASYFDIDDTATGDTFGDVLEISALSNRQDPQELFALHYSGVYGTNWYVEAQYSERQLMNAIGSGGPRDIIRGATWETVIDDSTFGSPPFCGECEDEERSNENALVKASYFLSTNSAGTHDISFGYDTFSDIAFDVNHQAGNDFRLAADDVIIDGQNAYPVLDPVNGSAWAAVWPVFGLDRVQKTDFETNSFFVNDRWQLNDKWSFNVGVRYDENDGIDAGGAKISDDNKISPRLGLTFDVKGDGDMLVNASYGSYVAALANNRADATATGGAIGRAILFYGGDPINTDPNCVARGDCITTDQATEMVMNWWLETTGFNPITDPPENIASIPGAQFLTIPGTESNTVIRESLKSPSVDEYTIGLTKRLGNRGSIRADVVYKDWTDFYSDRVTQQTGQVLIQGNPFDLTEVGNFGNDTIERTYTGLHLNFRYRPLDRLNVAVAYALSELEGNINGETRASGPVTLSPQVYPELKGFSQYAPIGALGADQTHKFRGWAIYDILQGRRHNLSVSWLQRFNSGTPYGALGAVDARPFADVSSYITPAPQVSYYFTDRDAFHTEDVTQSDLSFNYTFRFSDRFEVYIQPEVLNVFDEQAVIDVDTVVQDAVSDGGAFSTFDPFTETPVQGTHWALGDNFGQPIDENDFQTPRIYRFSVGFRF